MKDISILPPDRYGYDFIPPKYLPPGEDEYWRRNKQAGRPADNPDEIKGVKVDRKALPPGRWKNAGYESRQVFHLVITRHVTEYRAERLVNERGAYITAEFPEGLIQAAQYGNSVKAHGVYRSVEQLVSCERTSEHVNSQMNLPVSAGSICNFKKEAHEKRETFEEWVKMGLSGRKCCIATRQG